MDILSNRKRIVISEYAPEDTNVIWASGDFTNPRKIRITSMKQFVNGSWTEVMELSESD